MRACPPEPYELHPNAWPLCPSAETLKRSSAKQQQNGGVGINKPILADCGINRLASTTGVHHDRPREGAAYSNIPNIGPAASRVAAGWLAIRGLSLVGDLRKSSTALATF